MSDKAISIPGSTIFRFATILLNVCVLLGGFWVRSEIKAELKGYVSQAEFQTYKEDHDKWGKEVVKRLDENATLWTRRLDSLEQKMDRLIERKP